MHSVTAISSIQYSVICVTDTNSDPCHKQATVEVKLNEMVRRQVLTELWSSEQPCFISLPSIIDAVLLFYNALSAADH